MDPFIYLVPQFYFSPPRKKSFITNLKRSNCPETFDIFPTLSSGAQLFQGCNHMCFHWYKNLCVYWNNYYSFLFCHSNSLTHRELHPYNTVFIQYLLFLQFSSSSISPCPALPLYFPTQMYVLSPHLTHTEISPPCIYLHIQ